MQKKRGFCIGLYIKYASCMGKQTRNKEFIYMNVSQVDIAISFKDCAQHVSASLMTSGFVLKSYTLSVPDFTKSSIENINDVVITICPLLFLNKRYKEKRADFSQSRI